MLPFKCKGHDLYIHLFKDLSFPPYLVGCTCTILSTLLTPFSSLHVWESSLPTCFEDTPNPSLLDLRNPPISTWCKDLSHPSWSEQPSLSYLFFFTPSIPIYIGTPPFLTWFGDHSIPTCFGLPPFSSPYLDWVWEIYLICGPPQSLPVSKIPIYFLPLTSLPVWGQVMTCPPL